MASIYDSLHRPAPHEIPSDGTVNPAFRDGKSHAQFPVGEIAVRDQIAAGASAAPTLATPVT